MNNRIYLDGAEFTSAKDLDICFEDGEEIPAYITNIYTPLSDSAELSCECEIDPHLLAKITGVDLAQVGDLATSFTMTCSSPFKVQKRIHKKKRINKKWAKRYGYLTRFAEVRLTEVSLIDEQYRKDALELEFVGRGPWITLY